MCVLLLNGYNQLSARQGAAFAFCAAANGLQTPEHANYGATQHGLNLIYRPFASGTKKENDKIYVEENEVEEGELIFSRKHIKGGNDFTPFFFAQKPAYFPRHIKQRFSFYTCVSNTPSDRYLLLQTFRI